MSQNFIPTFVYQRRRHNNNSVSIFKNKVTTSSSSGICSVEESSCEEALTTDVDQLLNECNANENCSASKSNCSSYEAFEDISERHICISILRSKGLLDKVPIRQDPSSNESSHNYCLKLCKVCELSESSKNMLICDNCDDAFHASCCSPQVRILPVNEWLCSSCSKKKHKILKDKCCSSNLGSLEFMFTDTEPYMSNVRIGDEFQADVGSCRSPWNEECSCSGDSLEMAVSSNSNMQESDTIKPSKCSSIGNWLQCREVIEGEDGTVCAKWRRAPLFEVQTDNWECFRCVLWNPAHADCAVPQEVETEEVMKQLKYIEMLRPRLAAKRRKLDSSKKIMK